MRKRSDDPTLLCSLSLRAILGLADGCNMRGRGALAPSLPFFHVPVFRGYYSQATIVGGRGGVCGDVKRRIRKVVPVNRGNGIRADPPRLGTIKPQK